MIRYDLPTLSSTCRDYLLEFTGLGLKSVECVRLLSLQHVAFPVSHKINTIFSCLRWNLPVNAKISFFLWQGWYKCYSDSCSFRLGPPETSPWKPSVPPYRRVGIMRQQLSFPADNFWSPSEIKYWFGAGSRCWITFRNISGPDYACLTIEHCNPDHSFHFNYLFHHNQETIADSIYYPRQLWAALSYDNLCKA